MRKHASRIAIGLLTGAVIALTVLVVREAQVIQFQRHLILEMYQYLTTNCPLSQLN